MSAAAGARDACEAIMFRPRSRHSGISLSNTMLVDLPWLPAYDRRDALVVHELHRLIGWAHWTGSAEVAGKHASGKGGTGGGAEVAALAYSAYVAAQLRPSPGDSTVNPSAGGATKSLRAWLLERGIALGLLQPYGIVVCKPLAAEGTTISGNLPSLDDGRTEDVTGMTWLDAPSQAASQGPAGCCIPLDALRQQGWVVASGATCVLLSPLGAFAVDSPSDGRWAVGRTSAYRRARDALIFSSIFVFGVNPLVTILNTTVGLAHACGLVALATSRWSNFLAGLSLLLTSSTVPAPALYVDARLLCEGRVPLAAVAYNTFRANVGLFVLAAISSGALCLMMLTLVPHMRAQLEPWPNSTTAEGTAHGSGEHEDASARLADLSDVVVRLLGHLTRAVFLSYQALLVLVLVTAGYWRARRSNGQAELLG